VFWSPEETPQEVFKKASRMNEFLFKMKHDKYCWGGVFEVVIGDPRKAIQKTSLMLSSLCGAGL
jgi:hypothetical protein